MFPTTLRLMTTEEVPTLVVTAPSDNFVTSQVRTLVPIVVGAFVAFLVERYQLTDITATMLTLVLVPACIAGYYVVVRSLEHFASTKFGWLLGKPGGPVYPAGTMTLMTPTTTKAEG